MVDAAEKQKLIDGLTVIERNFETLVEDALVLADAVLYQSNHHYNPNDLGCSTCQALARVFALKKS